VNPARLDELLNRHVDATLDGAERAELERLLLDSPAARRRFWQFARLHSQIREDYLSRAGRLAAGNNGRWPDASGQWPVTSGQIGVRRERKEERGRRVESRELRDESEGEWFDPPDPLIPNPEIPRFSLPSPLSSIPTAWAFSYSVATVLLAIFLLGAWSYTITHPDADSLAVKNSRSTMPSGDAAKTTPEFTFVGRVSGMVDCQWSDEATATSPGAAVALNRRYALKSGLMEITYDSGTKVILQGPCDYTVESPRGGFLNVGKLVARVGAGGGGRGAGEAAILPSPASGRGAGGEGIQPRSRSALTLTLSGHHEVVGERGPNFNPTPHAPRPSPLFSVRTPTALVQDLGTEFGVEVLQSGETASHVFQGQVRVKVEGPWDEGREAGDKNPNPESPNSRIPNPEVILSAGQSARVEKDKTSGELKLLSGVHAAMPTQKTFVRRLREPPKLLDLLDIVAGGNGLGNRRERGIDPTTGNEDPLFVVEVREGGRGFQQVEWHGFIDGVFVLDAKPGDVQLDSAKHLFADIRQTAGIASGSIWARSPDIAASEYHRGWIYRIDRCGEFMPDNRGLLCLSSNVGITFDLRAMRRAHGAFPARLRATAGQAVREPTPPSVDGRADLWVFVDGQARFKQLGLRHSDGPVAVGVELGPEDRFLTILVGDGGDDRTSDWFVLGDPVIEMEPIKEQ
jgi:hypothetical protein